jgi:hypothetical protein
MTIKEKYKKETGLDLDIEIGSLSTKYYNEDYVNWLENQLILFGVVGQSEQLSDETEYCNKHKWHDCECTDICKRGLSIT